MTCTRMIFIWLDGLLLVSCHRKKQKDRLDSIKHPTSIYPSLNSIKLAFVWYSDPIFPVFMILDLCKSAASFSPFFYQCYLVSNNYPKSLLPPSPSLTTLASSYLNKSRKDDGNQVPSPLHLAPIYWLNANSAAIVRKGSLKEIISIFIHLLLNTNYYWLWPSDKFAYLLQTL